MLIIPRPEILEQSIAANVNIGNHIFSKLIYPVTEYEKVSKSHWES